MAAYPGTAISRESRATPDAGVLTDHADDLTIKQRRDAAGTRYRIQVIEEWITLAEYDALVVAFNTMLGPYELTLHGQDYVAQITNEPAIIARSGGRVRVSVPMVGVRTS